MSVPLFNRAVRGITAPVAFSEVIAESGSLPQGFAVGRMLLDGKEAFQITLSHAEGTVLTCLMTPELWERFVTQVSAATRGFNADHRASFGTCE